MDSESSLPQETLVFRECVSPIASKLRTRMQNRPNRSEQVTDIFGFLGDHLRQIGENVGRLADEVNQIGELRGITDTPENAMRRSAARMELCLERLLDDYDEVRRASFGYADSEGFRLLEKTYRDTLQQFQDWLDELIECLNDPMGALKKRGLVYEGGKPVPITLDLDFVPPPAMKDLERWSVQRGDRLINEEEARLNEASARRSRSGTGCLGLLATFGLGWWLGNAGEDYAGEDYAGEHYEDDY